MSKNDNAIRVFQAKVAAKRATLGEKPRPTFVTNKIIELPDGKVNLNILRTEKAVAHVAMQIGLLQMGHECAKGLLNRPGLAAPTLGDSQLHEIVEDLRSQLSIIDWDTGNKELIQLEAKLKAMLSDNAKVEDELDDIGRLLG